MFFFNVLKSNQYVESWQNIKEQLIKNVNIDFIKEFLLNLIQPTLFVRIML